MKINKNAGAGRVQLELKLELEKKGYDVDLLGMDYFFPKGLWIFSRFKHLLFPFVLWKFLRKNSNKYDHIELHQGNFPFSKKSIGFNGKLIVRSCGLNDFYYAFKKYSIRNGMSASGALDKFITWLHFHFCRASFNTSDFIHVPNTDEKVFLDMYLGLFDKTFYIQNTIPNLNMDKFSVREINEKKKVSFLYIGSFIPRKGSQDWKKFLEIISRQGKSLLMMGVGDADISLLQEFEESGSLKVVRRYNALEIDEVIGDSPYVGVFPSYCEGFGLGVLEMLSLGVPVISYNIPGPRDMISDRSVGSLVRVGDIELLAKEAIDFCQILESDPCRIIKSCKRVSKNFKMEIVVKKYLNMLSKAIA